MHWSRELSTEQGERLECMLIRLTLPCSTTCPTLFQTWKFSYVSYDVLILKYLIRNVCDRGHSFLSTNAELLERYADCATSAEVIDVQNQWLADLQAEPEPKPEGGHFEFHAAYFKNFKRYCASGSSSGFLLSLLSLFRSFVSAKRQLICIYILSYQLVCI